MHLDCMLILKLKTHIGLGMTKKIAITEEKNYFYLNFWNFKSPIQVSTFEVNWSRDQVIMDESESVNVHTVHQLFYFYHL